MTEQALLKRANNQCELCTGTNVLAIHTVANSPAAADAGIVLCGDCLQRLEQGGDNNHWRKLLDTMWSPVPAVQVMAWRTLKSIDSEPWAQEALDILYLDEELKAWAEAGQVEQEEAVAVKDCNGVALKAGDTVTIIKDLNVKGVSFVAKRGTSVRNISLTNNPEHIEGRVNGTKIVILSCFVKRSS